MVVKNYYSKSNVVVKYPELACNKDLDKNIINLIEEDDEAINNVVKNSNANDNESFGLIKDKDKLRNEIIKRRKMKVMRIEIFE